jgi:hypothetical protein
MLRSNIPYNPTPRWLVTLPRKDPTEKQQDAESENTVKQDPRIVFGETEFRAVREKYNMPKYVFPSEKSKIDSCPLPRSPWL